MKDFFRNQLIDLFQNENRPSFTLETGRTAGQFLEEYTPSGRKVITTLVQPTEYIKVALTEDGAKMFLSFSHPAADPADRDLEYLMKPIVVNLSKSVTAYSAYAYVFEVLHFRAGGNRWCIGFDTYYREHSDLCGEEIFATLNGTLLPTLRNYAKSAISRQNGDLSEALGDWMVQGYPRDYSNLDVFTAPAGVEVQADELPGEALLLRGAHIDTWHLTFNMVNCVRFTNLNWFGFDNLQWQNPHGYNDALGGLIDLKDHEKVSGLAICHGVSAEMFRRVMNLVITIRPDLTASDSLGYIRQRTYAALFDKKGRHNEGNGVEASELATNVLAVVNECEVV